MKKHQHALTGEGFTMEEADELLRGSRIPAMTKEQRQEYLTALERATARQRSEESETPFASFEVPRE